MGRRGEYANGRPAWDQLEGGRAGATFVEDVEPFEQRKLLLLNGSHSLMAYAASARGAETVADAIADPVVLEWVEQWWAAATEHLDLPERDIRDYRAALATRFGNPNIRHLLVQMATDGSQKLPIRAVPIARAAIAEQGQAADGTLRLVAAWVRHLRGAGAPVVDVARDEVVALAQGDLSDAVGRVLDHLGLTGAGHDDSVHDAVLRLVHELEQASTQ